MESASLAIDVGAEDGLPSAGVAVESLLGAEGPGAASEGAAGDAVVDDVAGLDRSSPTVSTRTIDDGADSIMLRFFCWSSSRAGSPSPETAESAGNPCAEPASFCAGPSTESASEGGPATGASGRSGGSPLSGWSRLGAVYCASSNPVAALSCAASLTLAELTLFSVEIGWEERTCPASCTICANEERSVAELMGDRLDRSYRPGFCARLFCVGRSVCIAGVVRAVGR